MQKIENTNQPMLRQSKGLDHHLCIPKTNMAFLAFNHPRDNNLTLSNRRGTKLTELLNKRLLRSFHITQEHNSQMSCMNERFALPTPVK